MADIELASGRILFSEGEASRHIYRVVSGEIEISRRTGDRVAVLGRVGSGSFVGEMGALVWAPRNGTARAVSDALLRRYRRGEFLAEVVRDPELSAQVLNGLSLRSRAQIEFLRGAQAPDRPAPGFQRAVEALRSLIKRAPRQGALRAAIARSGLTRTEFEPGAALFEEGAPSEGVFWIESGRVLVRTRNAGGGDRPAGHARAGEFLGEMGVLESLPRLATAVAATRVVARKMSPEEFSALLRRSPAAVLTVIDALCERARHTRALGAAAAWDGRAGNLLDALRSVDSMAQLAQQRLVDEALRARTYFAAQLGRGKVMTATYQNYLRGTATREEMEKANAVLRDYLKMAGIGTLLILPGAPVTIPLVAKLGKALGVDIFPSDVEAEMT
ncbi:MAG TPA: cyclic nucleotide-binding domain-containing protein [Burkholderiales bacterium]|nr:cyclic nucleotide-binding domain-containing protein [Burkholderiales bacterium]